MPLIHFVILIGPVTLSFDPSNFDGPPTGEEICACRPVLVNLYVRMIYEHISPIHMIG